ncbi:hypothetical protein PAP_08340 [Palaeococcus pacificus DY20341]|uniref:DUF86 domain-containing protein n=1 Tax=Palaeococcus pacificus DY20341 TaxID=1343739 RepID=A0A075LV88_9EURY|nr:HepT-like ribonuclease domain-containing protein [Palaeococcus pacificus]AIF70056.1 hypothetical protein PAP_08340 [Palaeococcus pacificus DY20341]
MIALVEESLRLIEKNFPETFEEFKSLGLAKDGMYKRLEFSIQLLLDELSKIRKDLSEEPVFSYGDIIKELHEKGVLSDDAKEKVDFLIQLREILIYNYDLLSDEIAFRNMKEYINTIREVLSAVTTYLEETK